jgi:hypothetical protein
MGTVGAQVDVPVSAVKLTNHAGDAPQGEAVMDMPEAAG